ncbi:hypothetical protein COP2_039080 [Malus domestica]
MENSSEGSSTNEFVVLEFWVRVCQHESHGHVAFKEHIAMVVGFEGSIGWVGFASALQREGRVGVHRDAHGGGGALEECRQPRREAQ